MSECIFPREPRRLEQLEVAGVLAATLHVDDEARAGERPVLAAIAQVPPAGRGDRRGEREAEGGRGGEPPAHRAPQVHAGGRQQRGEADGHEHGEPGQAAHRGEEGQSRQQSPGRALAQDAQADHQQRDRRGQPEAIVVGHGEGVRDGSRQTECGRCDQRRLGAARQQQGADRAGHEHRHRPEQQVQQAHAAQPEHGLADGLPGLERHRAEHVEQRRWLAVHV